MEHNMGQIWFAFFLDMRRRQVDICLHIFFHQSHTLADADCDKTFCIHKFRQRRYKMLLVVDIVGSMRSKTWHKMVDHSSQCMFPLDITQRHIMDGQLVSLECILVFHLPRHILCQHCIMWLYKDWPELKMNQNFNLRLWDFGKKHSMMHSICQLYYADHWYTTTPWVTIKQLLN